MNDRARILDILNTFEQSWVVTYDVMKIIPLMVENVLCITADGVTTSKMEFADILADMANMNSTVLHEYKCQDVEIKFASQYSASICATVEVISTTNGKTSTSTFFHSLSFAFIDNDWYITLFHVSLLKMANSEMKFSDFTNNNMDSRSISLIADSISGGIIGFYITEETHPLYVINDSMLNYLGYSREEFYETFSEDTSLIIHHDDVDIVKNCIDTGRCTKNDYELNTRIRKKDGTYLNMIQKARFSTDSDGKEILLAVFIDVTEMTRLQSMLEEQAERMEEQAAELSMQNEELIAQKERLEKQTEELAISEERFRVALQETSNIIFDCDMKTGKIVHSSIPQKANDIECNIQNVKYTLIIGGVVLPNYVKNLKNAFEAIRQGEPQAECVVKVKLVTNVEIWNKISIKGIADKAGKNVRAIGMIEDITRQKEAEIAIVREEQYRKAILADSLATYVINFTKGIFEECKVNSPYCLEISPGESYDVIIEATAKGKMSKEQQKEFIETFSLSNIVGSFRKGISELKQQYETFNSDGTHMWMETTTRVLLDTTSGEMKGFLYVNDIDQKKKEELELLRQSETDMLTGLYNKGATEKKIKEKLATNDAVQTGVFLMLDIDYFKQINDMFGHPCGDCVLKRAAEIILSNFRDSDIVGRLGGDEFCAFFAGISSKKRVEQVAERICTQIAAIDATTENSGNVTCSMGVSMCGGTAKTFEELYKEADAALYTVKNNGRNGYYFYLS